MKNTKPLKNRAVLNSAVTFKPMACIFSSLPDLPAWGQDCFPIRLFGLVNIGFIDLLRFYGGELVRTNPLLLRATAAAWVLALVGLGFAARKDQRWAFWAGLLLYATDMLPLIVMFSIWAFGVHGFFVFQWFKGQRALGELKETSPVAAAAAASR
ncbi:MAG TPA: hypothetical protein VHV32_04480 [Candidatus Angelobacter sp.]|nr:hypothetical protein [Candidatus Angelobacter sp.]